MAGPMRVVTGCWRRRGVGRLMRYSSVVVWMLCNVAWVGDSLSRMTGLIRSCDVGVWVGCVVARTRIHIWNLAHFLLLL